MDNTFPLQGDRVRRNTADNINRRIDRHTEDNIVCYSSQGNTAIRTRIGQLNKEWDIERALEITSGMNVLIGLGLAFTVNKKWLLLSAISASFLVQHALQGWCPPLPVFRWLGIRTKNEINRERDSLQEKLIT